MKILSADIIEEITVCPYCMETRSQESLGCCGESSCHFERAYVTKDLECYLESEVEII